MQQIEADLELLLQVRKGEGGDTAGGTDLTWRETHAAGQQLLLDSSDPSNAMMSVDRCSGISFRHAQAGQFSEFALLACFAPLL
jgi:hypothetical protein